MNQPKPNFYDLMIFAPILFQTMWTVVKLTHPSPGASSQTVISTAHALQHCFVQAQLETGAIKHFTLV